MLNVQVLFVNIVMQNSKIAEVVNIAGGFLLQGLLFGWIGCLENSHSLKSGLIGAMDTF